MSSSTAIHPYLQEELSPNRKALSINLARRAAACMAAFGLAFALAAVPPAVGGTFAPAAGLPGSTAIHKDDPRFIGWATGVEVVCGPQDIGTAGSPPADYGVVSSVLGKPKDSTADCLSLGDGGWATFSFDRPIFDGPGPDFAVFENAFADEFLELAFVEVSSDGANFFRFPAVSLTPTTAQIEGFGTLDPTNLYNLAGKYRQDYGTPFDLAELAGISPLLDLSAVTQVRVVDVVGALDDAYARFDSQGHKVNDPWPTDWASSGFDLEGVGVINAVPEPSTWALAAAACCSGLLVAARRSRRTARRA